MLEVVAAFGFCFSVVLLIAMCTKQEPEPEPQKKEEPLPAFDFSDHSDKKPIFQNDLEEASENVTFHVLPGGKDKICFPMDEYLQDVPETRVEDADREVLCRSFVMKSPTKDTENPAVVRRPDESSASYTYTDEDA